MTYSHRQFLLSHYLFIILVLSGWSLSKLHVADAAEYRDEKYIEYGDVTTDYPPYHEHGIPECTPDDDTQSNNETNCLNPADFVLNEFMVAGINLARYNNHRTAVPAPRPKHYSEYRQNARPFLLYHDFNIGDWIRGNETWMDLILIRRHLQRPSLSFYSDKVARKRWLGERGYPQPTLYFSEYKDQLVPWQPEPSQEELAAAILPHIPTNHGFCAKPNHMVCSERRSRRRRRNALRASSVYA